MILFPIIAVFTWWGVFRFRRRVLGLLIGAAGVAFPQGLVYLQLIAGRYFNDEWYSPEFHFLMYAYSALLLIGWVVLFIQPRRAFQEKGVRIGCHGCGYELFGLIPISESSEGKTYRCPECSRENLVPPTFAEKQRRRFAAARAELNRLERGA